MTDSTLNGLRLQQVKQLYSLSPNFRSEVDKLADSEIGKAKALIAQLSKLSVLETASNEKPVSVPSGAEPKRRGRPAGSKNKGPSKPRVKKAPVSEPVSASEVTNKSAIISALTNSPGLTAKQILEQVAQNGHQISTKNVLYSTLNTMKNSNVIKMSGDKPNTTYSLV